ncbi:MAG: nucleotidyltransferase family protein [Chitinophagaceae bacterium]|nr:nucleotidyltransferase family protein [Chitinophagaceae bacterium]
MAGSDTIIKKYNIIILAAGASTRLGEPKQLLRYGNVNLVQHAVMEARATDAKGVVVVVGSSAEQIIKSVENKGAKIVRNEKWSEGIGSSIRTGVEFVARDTEVDGVILMVCDQPYVSTAFLNELIAHQHSSKEPIVAAQYKDTVGTPALFHRSFFPALQELHGDAGAKKIMLDHSSEVYKVKFPLGDIDIDTRNDYEMLVKKNSEA